MALMVPVVLPALATPVIVNYQPHPPILIIGDGLFEVGGVPNLASGVRSGHGTAEDPCVISEWLIPPASVSFWSPCPTGGGCLDAVGLPNVRIQDTTKHVLLERNRLEGVDQALLGDNLGLWRAAVGLQLTNVENVTVDFLYAKKFIHAVEVRDSKNVTFRHLNLTEDQWGSWFGLLIVRSEVVIEDSWFSGHDTGVTVAGASSRIVIRNSGFENNSYLALDVVEQSAPVDARYNWWGSPARPSWGGGLPSVLFDPWLTAPPADAGYDSNVLTLGSPGITV